MKRSIILILALCSVAGSAFGLDMSIGGGFTYAPTNWKATASYPGVPDGEYQQTYNMGSVGLFFDATYLQVSVAYSWMLSGTYDLNDPSDFFGFGSFSGSGDLTFKWTYLNIGLLGKYPIYLGGFTLFPLLGFEYDLNLTYTDMNGNDKKSIMTSEEKDNLNMFFIEFGVGADFNLTERLYIRPELLFAVKLNSQLENDNVNNANASGVDLSYSTTRWDFSLLLGYKL